VDVGGLVPDMGHPIPIPVWTRAWIRYATTEFAITDRRVVAKTGFVRRQTVELDFRRIESVSMQQSILGRMLGYATILVRGTGGTQGKFRHIAEPLVVRRLIADWSDQCE